MTYKPLDVVVLQKEVPRHALRKGDVGTVLDVYEPDGLEVEFLSASGDTEAVVTLKDSDVRAAAKNDLLTVRSYGVA